MVRRKVVRRPVKSPRKRLPIKYKKIIDPRGFEVIKGDGVIYVVSMKTGKVVADYRYDVERLWRQMIQNAKEKGHVVL